MDILYLRNEIERKKAVLDKLLKEGERISNKVQLLEKEIRDLQLLIDNTVKLREVRNGDKP